MKFFRSTQFYINLILLIALLFFTRLLCIDFQKRLEAGKREPIGEVILQLKDTKRKFHSEVIWEPISKNFPVYNKDTIRTDEYSEVVVKLKNGTEVKLEENSMAIFSISEDELNINFSNGAIQLENANNVKLTSNENQFSIQNGKLKAVKGYTDLVSMNVQEGNVTLKSQDKTETIEKNTNVKVKEKRILRSEKIPLLLNPVSNYFTTSSEKYSIQFQWVPVSVNSSYKLEISNAKTRELVFQKLVSEDKLEISLPEGNYRWRLVPISKEEVPSEFAKFAIVSNKPIQVLSPQNDAKYVYAIHSPKILFRWIKEEFFKSYKLEISNQPDFSQILAEYNSLADQVLVEKLEQGKYYYRIIAIPILSGMPPKQSLVGQFEVAVLSQPESIQLVSPENEKQIVLSKKEESQKTFVWKKNREYSEYEFQISKSPNFESLVYQESTKEHFIILKKNLEIGNYFWRVRGKFRNQVLDSEVRNFFVVDIAKISLLNPSHKEVLEAGNLNFTWNEYPSSISYIFELSKEPSFNKIFKTLSSNSNSVSLTLRDKGTYYWRVKTDSGKISSEIREFTLIPEPKIEILFPKNQEIVDLYPVNELKLAWNSTVPLSSYRLEIVKIPEKKVILLEKNISKNSYTIKNLKLFKRGDYELKISADYIQNEKTKILTSTTRFTITLSKVSTKDDIKFITPKEVYVE